MEKIQTKALSLLFVCMLAVPVASFANDCNDVPLDGGISMLAIAGIGYGIKKVADKTKKNQAK